MSLLPTSTIGADATIPTGSKSFRVCTGAFGYKVGEKLMVLIGPISSV